MCRPGRTASAARPPWSMVNGSSMYIYIHTFVSIWYIYIYIYI